MKSRLLFLFLMMFTFGKAQVTAGLIQHFKFDNSYANVAGTTSFSATSFDTDRSGYANSAIRMTYALQSQATIPGLPYGNAARTISFWTKSLADAGVMVQYLVTEQAQLEMLVVAVLVPIELCLCHIQIIIP